ncbi:hypothetical protein pb186bvf_004236 [Paramecium bursaria]
MLETKEKLPLFLRCIFCDKIPSDALSFGRFKVICRFCTRVYKQQFGNNFFFQPIQVNHQFLLGYIRIKCSICQEAIIIKKYEKHLVQCGQKVKQLPQTCQINKIQQISEEKCLEQQQSSQQCEACRQLIKLNMFQFHYYDCLEQIVQCDNQNCYWQGKRENFIQHYEKCTQKNIDQLEISLEISKYTKKLTEFLGARLFFQKITFFDELIKIHQEESEDEQNIDYLKSLMMKFQNENDVPQMFLCKICKQICVIPVYCWQCENLVCHACIGNNQISNYYCYCNKDNNYVPEIISSYFLNEIYIKCKYCQVFKKYSKYQQHVQICRTIHTSKIDYTKYFSCNQETFNCELCKQKSYVKFNCLKCLHYFCITCFYENKQGLCQSLCGQQYHQLIEDKSFKIKLNCNNCNLIIDNDLMIKHTKVCIIENNIQKAAQKEYQSNASQKYPFYVYMTKKSLQEANIYQQHQLKYIQCRVDDNRLRQKIIDQNNQRNKYMKRLKNIQDYKKKSINK